MEDALVRGGLLVFAVHEQLLEGLGSCGSAVQGQEADRRRGGGLVGERLGNLEVVQRWRANRPRAAENLLVVTVDDGEFGRVGFRGKYRDGGLSWCQYAFPSAVDVQMCNAISTGRHTFQAWVAFPHNPKHVVFPPVMYTSHSCVAGVLTVGLTVNTSFQFSRVSSCWTDSVTFADAALTGFEGAAGTADDMAAVAWLK